MVELTRARGRRRARRRRPGAAVRGRRRSTAPSPPGCSTTCPTSIAALAELARVLRPGGRLVAVTNSARPLRELWELVGARERRDVPFGGENGEERSCAPLRARRAPRRRRRRRRSRRARRPYALRRRVARAAASRDACRPARRAARRVAPRRSSSSPRRHDDPPGRADRAQARRRGALAPTSCPSSCSATRAARCPTTRWPRCCMAVYFRGLTAAETFALTDAMIRSRRDARSRRGARPQGRRQALDGRRGRQDVDRGRRRSSPRAACRSGR